MRAAWVNVRIHSMQQQPSPLEMFVSVFVSSSDHSPSTRRAQGIPLGASVALKLADSHGRDVGFAYNRKERKDHGDKGSLVGAPMEVGVLMSVSRFTFDCCTHLMEAQCRMVVVTPAKSRTRAYRDENYAAGGLQCGK